MEEQSPKALSQHSTPICTEVPLTFAIFLAFLCEPLLALLVNLPRQGLSASFSFEKISRLGQLGQLGPAWTGVWGGHFNNSDPEGGWDPEV
jgi:hypothetical protein